MVKNGLIEASPVKNTSPLPVIQVKNPDKPKNTINKI
jgi:hypothetical protein